jgi:hypothetical protein
MKLKHATYLGAFLATIVTALAVKGETSQANAIHYKQCRSSLQTYPLAGTGMTDDAYCTCYAKKMPAQLKAARLDFINMIQAGGSTQQSLSKADEIAARDIAAAEVHFICFGRDM